MKFSYSKSADLNANNFRLDAGPYASDGYIVRNKISSISCIKDKLSDVTLNGINGIYHVGQEKLQRVTSPEHGASFLRSSDIMRSDLTAVSLISKDQVAANSLFSCPENSILITRSGTIGNMAFARKSLAECAISQDVLKLVADEKKIGAGYLYSYLASKYGVPQVKSGTFGSIIVHIEAEDICDIEVPRFKKELEVEVDSLIKSSSSLRSEYEKKCSQATQSLFASVGLKDITPYEWHNQGADTGYSVTLNSSRSIRALNFNNRYRKLVEKLKSVEHKTLGSICEGGLLSRGGRFKRVDASPEYGIQLIGQKQGFWAKPEGRWIAPKYAKDEIVVSDETVLIASQGTLGEREVFCRPIFATGKWLEFGYSEHFLRVFSSDPDVSGAYLFAFLRSETAFRCLRSMSIGSKQQDIHVGMLSELPVPIIDEKNKAKVEALIREAFIAKDSADEKEKQAITLVEDAIAEAVK